MATEAHQPKFVYIPKPALIASLILHGALLVLLVATRTMDSLGLSLFLKPTPHQKVVQDFIQVDMVALPDQMIHQKIDVEAPKIDSKMKPAHAPAPAVPKATELVIPLKPSPTPVKPKPDPAQERVKHLEEQEEALQRLRSEANRENALKALSRPVLKGNRLSKGLSTKGTVGTREDQYAALVKKAIQQHFSIYVWQKKRPLIAVVFLEIFPNGRVKQKKIVNPSPDSLYNSSVMRAVEAAEPLPIPEDLDLLSGGLTLEFKSQE